MRVRLAVALALALAGCGAARHESTMPMETRRGLRVELTVPPATPETATVFIAGTFNRWNPAHPEFALARHADGRYRITLPDTVRGPVEFKFTLGSWETVETDASGGTVVNRALTIPADAAPVHAAAVAGWNAPAPPRTWPLPTSTATSSVSILDWDFRMAPLDRARRVWIYLPPDYAASTKRYPVLYMHDGQNVFDNATSYVGEWGVDEALDSLHAAGDHGAIVVAVDHGGSRRFDEYSPWVNATYGGGEGDRYVDFLVQTLKPYIDANYRTRPDRLNTGVMGSSMGGLISLYAMLRYPEVFGRAGVFSPAFWVAPEFFPFARQARPVRPDPRIYFVVGGREGETVSDAARYVSDQARMVDLLIGRGFQKDIEVAAFVRPDARHTESFWRAEFPAAYQWLFR